jgi:hypothetical protein
MSHDDRECLCDECAIARLDFLDPLPKNMPHCPKCWTYGHEHRKTCPYVGQGMDRHIRPPATSKTLLR